MDVPDILEKILYFYALKVVDDSYYHGLGVDYVFYYAVLKEPELRLVSKSWSNVVCRGSCFLKVKHNLLTPHFNWHSPSIQRGYIDQADTHILKCYNTLVKFLKELNEEQVSILEFNEPYFRLANIDICYLLSYLWGFRVYFISHEGLTSWFMSKFIEKTTNIRKPDIYSKIPYSKIPYNKKVDAFQYSVDIRDINSYRFTGSDRCLAIIYEGSKINYHLSVSKFLKTDLSLFKKIIVINLFYSE